MSHSKRKTPIIGHCSDIDKPFKEAEHRRERHAVKIALRTESDIPAPKTFGNPWASCKDGKAYVGFGDPKLIRK